ncbi:hypothetical protein [Flavobacterium sp.]|uniref:hypothetical protein n=1 Tax=Flavobacterium sp. TaxID=239 RepID=UPI0035AF69BA
MISKQLRHFLKFIILILTLSISICCNTKSNNTKETKRPNNNDTIVVKETKTEEPIKDSIKMHAFDNLYFGTQGGKILNKYSVNGIDYIVKTSKSKPGEGLCYFMLESDIKITTKKKAEKVLNDLENTISRKYKNGTQVNKTLYVKHPEEKENNEGFFDERTLYKYDKKTIGLAYEFIKSKWNLNYKEIQIGYLVDHKNRTVLYQTSPKEDDNYIIYIELESKVIMPEKRNSDKENVEKDSNKF